MTSQLSTTECKGELSENNIDTHVEVSLTPRSEKRLKIKISRQHKLGRRQEEDTLSDIGTLVTSDFKPSEGALNHTELEPANGEAMMDPLTPRSEKRLKIKTSRQHRLRRHKKGIKSNQGKQAVADPASSTTSTNILYI